MRANINSADELGVRLLMLNTGIPREDAVVMWAAPDLLEACKIMRDMLVERGCAGLAGTIMGENAIKKAERK